MITFKKGKQEAGTVVIDANGIAWEVLKDISNAQAQPREGAYYTKHVDEKPSVLERLDTIEEWIAKQSGMISPAPAIPIPAPVIPTPSIPLQRGAVLKDMFGINAYPWNFTQDPADINITNRIYKPKFDQIKSFSAVRHYIDRHLVEEKEGVFTFEPTHRGSWCLDLIFQANKDAGILNLVCPKEAQKFLYEKHPDPKDGRHIPFEFGLDPKTAKAYGAISEHGYQYAARYGSNKNIPAHLIKVDTSQRWTNDPENKVKIGLGTVTHMESDNERDIWWAYEMAYSSPEEYAAQCSAFYDGHKGEMGPGFGVKSADPNMIVVMGGLATPSTDYVRKMVEWCRVNRGYRADGSVDLCWDIINYHQYSNDGQDSGQWGYASRGVAPELRTLEKFALEFVALGKELNQPVWVTETGYDVLPTPQSSNPIGNKSAEDVQADWLVRTALLYARCGVERLFYYQLFDDNPGSGIQYSSSGVAGRPAALLIDWFSKEIGDFSFLESSKNANGVIVDTYQKDGQHAYVCFIADEKGRSEDFTLIKKDGSTRFIKVTETPVIIK